MSVPLIRDSHLYQPNFSPWVDDRYEFRQVYDRGSPRSLVSWDRVWVIYQLLQQALHLPGEIWEIGVYKGGTAAMIAEVLKRRKSTKTFRAFDTFQGMPESTAGQDIHQIGEFSDTSYDEVHKFIGYEHLELYKADIRYIWFDSSSSIAFAHLDVDNYQSTLAALELVWPRLLVGGMIVEDDYGHRGCPGARAAVDEFFAGIGDHFPVCIPTGQAVIFKSK